MRRVGIASLGIFEVWLAGVVLIALATPSSAAGHRPRFKELKPGEFVVQRLDIPVRVVLIGFEDHAIDEDALRSWLPQTYKPVVRAPLWYGLNGRDVGLEYKFKYDIVYKDPRFADRLFRHLAAIGTEGDLTSYQVEYNDSATNLIDITGPILYVDAPSVEQYLDENAGRDRGYTIYFVNWYGRSDFRFHVYTRTDQADPDTGVDFGALDFNAIISWGGTSSRSWFYDFSAGPEFNMAHGLVDFPDLDGNGVEDYRMPNTWEYATGGYRDPEAIGGDMGLLSRFVAINLLFTSSPSYDPLVTAPRPFGAKVAHLTLFEDDPANDGSAFVDMEFARAQWHDLQPYYSWTVGFSDFDPIDPATDLSLDITAGLSDDPGCWTPFGFPSAQLFCHFSANLATYVPAYGPRDYVAEIFGFNTTRDVQRALGFLGFADDNWVDGTQTFSFLVGSANLQRLGYGFTASGVHEMGHHLGLSHPHDGYDSELGLDYGPADDMWFAWVGDESDTVMHYLKVSNGFGTHNEDNMHRWETAGYLNWANALAGDLLASDRWYLALLALFVADRAADEARDALRGWRYLRAARKAREAYVILAEVADRLGVTPVTLNAARMALPGRPPAREACRPRQLEEQQLLAGH